MNTSAQHTIQDLDQHPVAAPGAVEKQVPVIDVADLIHDSASSASREAIDQIADACRTWGFFQVVNHGIARQEVEQVWQQTHALFGLPLEEKLQIERSKENPWGFYNRELTKNQLDKKEVFDFTRPGVDPIYQQTNRWLPNYPEFRSTMETYLESCTRLSLNLLEAFCLGLDLPAKFMHADFENNHTGFVRLNYYPLEVTAKNADGETEEADLGIHHHTDAGALTVLLQADVSGLQVHRDGMWHDIPVVEGAMVINTGDMMQVWSNDIYKAAIHRVLAMEARERYSIPFFFNPASDCEVKPLPSVVSEQTPDQYDSIIWGEFRGRRSDGDYADYGTEVQISQYRR
ncbi:MAG: 2OG-Fe(II) oxygenase family protein [Pseudomonadota bacterium]